MRFGIPQASMLRRTVAGNSDLLHGSPAVRRAVCQKVKDHGYVHAFRDFGI